MQLTLTKNKMPKDDSTVILKSLRALMGLGNSLFEAIELQEEIEEKNNKKILKKIVYFVKNKNNKIEKQLLKYGMIDNSEYLILLHSKDAKEAINDIIKIRAISSNFIKTLITLILPIIIGLMVGLGIVHFLLPVIRKPVDQMIAIVQIKKGVELDSLLNIPNIFFYIKHPESAVYIFFGFIALSILIVFSYLYFIKNKPYVIYKILKLKARKIVRKVKIILRMEKILFFNEKTNREQ